MTIVRKVASNISYLLIARTAFRFLTAVALIYAANWLGADRFGQLETATAWANAFLALNDIGMSVLIIREGSRDEKKMAVYFGNTLIVEVILSIIIFGVIMGLGVLFQYDSTTLLLMAIMASAGLIYEFRKVMRGIFRVMMKLKFVAVLEVLNGLTYLLVALWIFSTFTDKNLGLLGLAHARLWVNVAVIAAFFIYTIRFIKPKFDSAQLLPMVKQSYIFTLYNLFFMLYFQIDQIILSIMRGETEVGIYGASSKIIVILFFVPQMIFQVVMPIMFRLSKSDVDKYKRLNNTIWRYIAAIGIPSGIGIILLADSIIPLIYTKPEYLASIPVLTIMGGFLAIRFIGISQGNALTTYDKEHVRAYIQIVSVIINIVLDIWLIASYGAVGAAIATLITEAVIAISFVSFAAKYLEESIISRLIDLLPIIAATTIMALFVILAKPLWHVMVVVILGAIVYGILLWIFRFFRPYDKKIFKQLVS